MGRFHRHDDGTVHSHGPHGEHSHAHDAADGAAHGHAHDGPAHAHGHAHDAAPAVGDGIGPVDGAAHGHGDDVGDHSGYKTGPERIEVLERIFDENDAAAAANRAALDAAGVVAVNLMSSPGAGKTTLLAATLDALAGRFRCGVVEGDIETALDADKLRGRGAQIALLNTGAGFGGECHLDAPMVAQALRGLDLASLDLLLIENVGNLVCPAEFDVGAHRKAMVFSVAEGEDKPLKYPVMFRVVDAVVLNKVDLLPYVPFDVEAFEANLRQVNPTARLIETNALTGEGVQSWLRWLESALADRTG
ncbi:MAG: hydrogenase nickel incorporation protein HypB [Bifidobacteriaceae bacterium]|jgi:hydrogenase nickel incorporation protein HypB|nr:hydrogenase nickel incorporation protein HypB [Bifidobacteriaceae bacterium]